MARKPSWLRRLHQEQALLLSKVFNDVHAEINEKSEPIVIVKGAFNGRHSTGYRNSHLDYNGRLTYLNAPPTDLAATIKARSGLGPNKDEIRLKAIGSKFGLQITADKVQRFDQTITNTFTDQRDIDFGRPLDGNPDEYHWPTEDEDGKKLVRVGTFKNGKPKYKEIGRPDAIPKFKTVYKKRPRYK